MTHHYFSSSLAPGDPGVFRVHRIPHSRVGLWKCCRPYLWPVPCEAGMLFCWYQFVLPKDHCCQWSLSQIPKLLSPFDTHTHIEPVLRACQLLVDFGEVLPRPNLLLVWGHSEHGPRGRKKTDWSARGWMHWYFCRRCAESFLKQARGWILYKSWPVEMQAWWCKKRFFTSVLGAPQACEGGTCSRWIATIWWEIRQSQICFGGLASSGKLTVLQFIPTSCGV